MKITKAEWGGVDVLDKVYHWFVRDDKLSLNASNHYLTDTKPGIEKKLHIWIEDNGVEHFFEVNEGANLKYPQTKYFDENCLIMTSCNRVEQCLFALAVNSRIIQQPFNLVVADCSTPDLKVDAGVSLHSGDDPYNQIKDHNYNPDWTLFKKWIPTFPNIKNYEIIHVSPRLAKQRGEATLMSLGSMMGTMMGSKYGLKLTGVCHLKQDWVSNLNNLVEDYDITTIKRGSSNQSSTRVTAFQNDKFSEMLSTEGYKGWIDEYDFIERKLDIIAEKWNRKRFEGDERSFIVDEGLGRNDHREIITANLEKHNLLDCDDYFIKKFKKGKIW
jgi:hypothetical protein